jgi:hypothetical protein
LTLLKFGQLNLRPKVAGYNNLARNQWENLTAVSVCPIKKVNQIGPCPLRNQKETAMSEQLENRVTQPLMKAYVARRWGRDHQQLVRDLKESGLYQSILDSVSANMAQSVNELLANGWFLLEALDYAYNAWATAPSTGQCD